MLNPTLTHAWPWNEPDDVAWCGRPITAAEPLSNTPTCPICADAAASEAALEARLAEEACIEMTDADAQYAGVAVFTPEPSPLFAVAIALTRNYARAVRGGGR